MKSIHWPLAGVAALLLSMQAQAADGQKIYTQGGANPAAMACATCHGADAMGMAAAGFPRLAGIDAGYSRKQLDDFRSGARSNPIMQPIAAALSDEIRGVRAGEESDRRFELDPSSFSQVPTSPFAYWVSERVRRLFKELPPFEGEGRTVKQESVISRALRAPSASMAA